MKCFISYSWESASHKNWVREFAAKLRNNGVDVTLDQWDTYPGIDLTMFMEKNIRESDYVIMICTPTYAEKANVGAGGVGYEKMIVTGEIYQGVGKPGKFVPILRAGEPQNALPSFLRSSYYLDFSEKAKFNEGMETLLQHIFQHPTFRKPPIGPKPTFGAAVRRGTLQTDTKRLRASFKDIYEFAYSSQGMNKGRSEAEGFATHWTDQYRDRDFSAFKEAYTFAYSSQGMNKGRSEAEAFATNWTDRFPDRDFSVFKEAYTFSYSSLGMDKDRSGAEAFATNWTDEYPDRDFSVFKEAYTFAYSSRGMNKDRSGAENFAFSKI